MSPVLECEVREEVIGPPCQDPAGELLAFDQVPSPKTNRHRLRGRWTQRSSAAHLSRKLRARKS